MHPMLNVAVKAARRAATIINRASLNLERLQIDRKQHNDFVTEVDKLNKNKLQRYKRMHCKEVLNYLH